MVSYDAGKNKGIIRRVVVLYGKYAVAGGRRVNQGSPAAGAVVVLHYPFVVIGLKTAHGLGSAVEVHIRIGLRSAEINDYPASQLIICLTPQMSLYVARGGGYGNIARHRKRPVAFIANDIAAGNSGLSRISIGRCALQENACIIANIACARRIVCKRAGAADDSGKTKNPRACYGKIASAVQGNIA